MPTPHPFTDPDQPDRQQAENTQRYLNVLHGLIDVGANLARLVNQQAESDAAERAATGATVLASAAPDASVAFERIARAVRRTIILARHVAEPVPERQAGADASRQRTAARQRIIRSVEDTIGQEVRSHERAESLHAEMLERLDGPDVDDSLADRPIGEIISEIHRDLGLHAMPGMALWKRRTPADIAVLRARAAGESVPATAADAIRERPPSAWTGRGRIAALADADDAMLGDAEDALLGDAEDAMPGDADPAEP